MKQRMVRDYETSEAFVAGEGRVLRNLETYELSVLQMRPRWRLDPDGSQVLGRQAWPMRAAMSFSIVLGLCFAGVFAWINGTTPHVMNSVAVAFGLVAAVVGGVALLTGPGALARSAPLRVHPSGSVELCTAGVTIAPAHVIGLEMVEADVLYTNTGRRERMGQARLVVRLPGGGAGGMARVLLWEVVGEPVLPTWSAELAEEIAAMFGLTVDVRKDPEEMRLVESTGD